MDLFKSVQIHMLLWALLRMKNEYLSPSAYHAFLIFTVGCTALATRILQVGASSVATACGIEAISIGLEMKEVYYFSKEMTIIDEFKDVARNAFSFLKRAIHRTGAKVAPVAEATLQDEDGGGSDQNDVDVVPAANHPNGGRVSEGVEYATTENHHDTEHRLAVGTRRSAMFCMMLMDIMVAEGIASILSFASFFIYQYSFDENATELDQTTILTNGLVSVVSELLISDTAAIVFLSWKGACTRKSKRVGRFEPRQRHNRFASRLAVPIFARPQLYYFIIRHTRRPGLLCILEEGEGLAARHDSLGRPVGPRRLLHG